MPNEHYNGLIIDVENLSDNDKIDNFNLNLKSTKPHYRADGRKMSSIVYESDFKVNKQRKSIYINWSDFKPYYRGKLVENAPKLNTEHVTELSIMYRSKFKSNLDGKFNLKVYSLKTF